MPARRRAPTVTNWARELQVSESGDLELSELTEILVKADRRLEEMWAYLRDVDTTSAQNLKAFESFLEVVYRLIKSGVPTGPSARAAAVNEANQTLPLIDATKIASRVLRRVGEKAEARSGADATTSSDAAAEHEMANLHYAVINSIDSLRTRMASTVQLFQEEAMRKSGTGPGGSSSAGKTRQRRHHQPWSIAG